MDESIRSKIEGILEQNKVVLFMKGTPSFPQCGFSARAVAILNELKTPFEALNVLEDPALREGIKEYGQWPTIPQLYVKKELVGGSDIMLEMYQSGELGKVISD